MGRKSNNKGKERREEKRLAQKEHQAKLARSLEAIQKANQLEDPMEPFPAFRKFQKNGIDAELYVKRVIHLDEAIKEWIFDLEKRNMKQKYDDCSWGWRDWKKKDELMHDSAWYLIAQTIDGVKIGFSHFRFDLESEIEVLYCYELQIEPEYVGKGLGKFMMQILELIAFTNNMRKVVLTILKNNPCSNFFKHIKYQIDEPSLCHKDEASHPYEILSKVNKKLISTEEMEAHHGHGHSHNQSHCCPGHH
ncbi:N-alpha-acetyltransferase 40 [Onthophagus taurus]|uniref:N-alpha-acetyltransferase 40 n=1 Tax=Onthophagus taurus TaxID=166361 RepID=UPI000C209249|nr:N-alpha-acetyltransferase 40 [Onthophagus taurus]